MFGLPNRPLRAVGRVVTLLVCAAPLAAAQPGAVAPSYDVLLARLDEQPAALEAAALAQAAHARATQARAIANPTLSWEAENLAGSGSYSGSGSAEISWSVSQPLELFGQRSARVGAALAEAQATDLRSEQLRWQAAGRLALVYAQAEAAARHYQLASEAFALASEDAQAVAQLVTQGREPTLRQVLADSETETARAALEAARSLQIGAFARLSATALLDDPVQSIAHSLLDRSAGAVAHAGDTALAVRVAQAELEAASRRLLVEQRRARPELSATAGARRFRESDDEAFTIGLSLSIPLFDRNRAGISAAHAEQRAAEARLAAQQQQTRADQLAAVATLTASNSQVRSADKAIAAAEEAYRLARIGFEAGRISQLELRSTRTALLAASTAAVDARLARVLAEIDLARLEGRVPFGVTP